MNTTSLMKHHKNYSWVAHGQPASRLFWYNLIHMYKSSVEILWPAFHLRALIFFTETPHQKLLIFIQLHRNPHWVTQYQNCSNCWGRLLSRTRDQRSFKSVLFKYTFCPKKRWLKACIFGIQYHPEVLYQRC